MKNVLKKYKSICRFCGAEFVTTIIDRDYCKKSKCRLRAKNFNTNDETDKLNERVRLADKISKEVGTYISYGKISLLLEHDIKTF